MAKKSAKKIDDVLVARRQEIDSALDEIVETLEKYFLVTPFDFIEGKEAEGTYYLFSKKGQTPFNRFDGWNDVQMCKLFPEAREAQRQLDDQGREDHSDEAGELAFAAQRFGFVVGVLVGMKNMGASKEELIRRS
jgi:hypothetical protein